MMHGQKNIKFSDVQVSNAAEAIELAKYKLL